MRQAARAGIVMRGILTYHSIDETGSPISCRPETFTRHARWLASGRVKVVPLATLLTLPDDTDAVAITFDDAFRNFKEQALPRLRDHGLPSTVFVVAGRAGGTNAWNQPADPKVPVLPLLEWAEIGAMASDDVVLGSHSMTHPDLTCFDAARIEDEVRGSADAIAQRVGVRPTTFAYPYGRLNARVAAAVASTYELACTTDFRPLTSAAERVRLPRLDAYYFDRSCPLESWGTPPFLAFVRRRLRLRQARQVADRMLDWRPGR